MASRMIRQVWWAPLTLSVACAPATSLQHESRSDNPLLSSALVPSPALSPEEVVEIQIEALRHNDARNSGIEVAFRFASPSNKRNTGPLPRFIDMIKNGPYSLMLEARQVVYDPVEITGNQARQRVVLYGATTSLAYVFYLSRQEEEPCVGCWMTDRVTIERVEGRQAGLIAAPLPKPGAHFSCSCSAARAPECQA